MSLYAFHLGQIISTVLGQVDHGSQDGNAAQTRIQDEMSETDHTQKRRFRHGANFPFNFQAGSASRLLSAEP